LVPTPPPIDSGPTGDTGKQAQNTLGTLGAKRKSSSSKAIRKSDRGPKKKSKFGGKPLQRKAQSQAQPCKLIMWNFFIYWLNNSFIFLFIYFFKFFLAEGNANMGAMWWILSNVVSYSVGEPNKCLQNIR
jgi:hypothetical protein